MGVDGGAPAPHFNRSNKVPGQHKELPSTSVQQSHSDLSKRVGPHGIHAEDSGKGHARSVIKYPYSGVSAQRRLRNKGRLPWLDGSESRRPSNPNVPGAFREELHRAPGDVTLRDVATSVQRSPDTPQSTAPTDSLPATPKTALSTTPSGPSVPSYPPPNLPTREPSPDLVSPADIRRGTGISTLESLQVNRETLDRMAPPTIPLPSASTDSPLNKTGIPSVPVIASQLGQRRATSDSVSSAVQSEVTPPAKIDELRNPTTEVITPQGRQPSISVQPIRANRVRPNAYEQSLSNRQPSIAVPPIRTRTYQSLSEDTARKVPKETQPAEDISIQRKAAAQWRSQSFAMDSANEEQTRKNLRDSIAGLENLMQEAMRLAKEAASHDRASEVPELLEEAKVTLRRVSEVQDTRQGLDRNALRRVRRVVSSSDESESYTHDFSDSSDTSSSSSGTSERKNRYSVRVPPNINNTQQRNDTATLERAYAESHKQRKRHVRSRCWKGKGKANNTSDPPPELPTQPGRSHLLNRDQVNHVNRSQTTREEPSHPHDRVSVRSNFPPGHALPTAHRDMGFEGTQSLPRPEDTDPKSPLDPSANPLEPEPILSPPNWGRDKYDEKDFVNADVLKDKHHLSLKDGQRFSLHRNHKRQPIARNWSTLRKRFTASVACFNTALVGMLIGIYAGEVPAIQYILADQLHHVILGNVVLYVGMGLTTLIFWPLPLLHGRKPYTMVALLITLPLQFPQAIVVSSHRHPGYQGYKVGLLLSRAIQGFALGFAQINFKSTLLDLFGSSLQSNNPHGEMVLFDDIRRHGGGMGLWLGIWSWCFIGSLAIGFLIGADIISGLNVAWGFYISVILIAVTLFLNILTPETRRAPHRRTVQEVELPNDVTSRRVARGEIRMHVSGDGPKWWWEEVFAGLYLSFRMLSQSAFLVMALYMAWIYAEVVLIIVLLGNLLSKEYSWRPEYVGLGVLSVAVGAFFAIPNSKANIFSRSRVQGPRTDSMTFQPRVTWTSHLIRRALFMTALPIAGLAYTLASAGTRVQYMAPIVLAGLIGYISNLAIAECNGIIMETFDTSDLQPGTNSRHRLQSLPQATRRRRTMYSSYPRVSAGFFSSQALGFFFAAAATGVGGAVTRHVGAQKATAITAGILLGLTLLLTCALWRFKDIQMIPNEMLGHYFGAKNHKGSTASVASDKSWRAVVIGNPSGKVRRMSWLELGGLSRWTEIRRLNRLLSRRTTQPLNPGWQ